MSRKHQKQYIPSRQASKEMSSSLIDIMKDGREFESLLNYSYENLNITNEITRSLQEIESTRGHPVICYIANTVSPNLKVDNSVNSEDELPINELIASVPMDSEAVDMIVVTPGGSAQEVDKIVNALRSRFHNVSFILPAEAMSAGSILIMSGDEIIMNATSYFGPIDPQVIGRNGSYVPAQSILEVIEVIQKRGQELINKGQSPLWTDLQILNHMDPREIGAALAGSNYSIDLVQRYLNDYKFRKWTKHNNGTTVTDDERKMMASEIAGALCDHSQWKVHGHGITRDVAKKTLKLEIIYTETIQGLDRAIRRFWALMYWIFQNTTIYKLYVSSTYFVAKNVNVIKEN
jgi:ATP-dependent protease ClpP protease subunit